ncbi:hypothetical protein Tco_1112122 [Tanacetum coccineum]|uniref:Uncharacterized protein n=1 Tax=Tanacetum coccineum TaxID=301880 RepID=A0ABQ5IS39_9ASTR
MTLVNERQIADNEEKVDTIKHWMLVWLTQKAVGHNQKSRIQAADQGMMHMLMMQISDPYMMKSQWLRMEAYCVNLEIKYQNQALKEGQHGQFSKVKSNEAKVKHDIDVIETINIELEHKVAKLLKESETLKKDYKDLPTSREKEFAMQALKNDLRKLTGNSGILKFQTTVASQVCEHDLSKPSTTHICLGKEKSVFAKPSSHIAPSSSRYSSNDMVYNHNLEEAKKKTQERGRNSRPSMMPSARSQSTSNDLPSRYQVYQRRLLTSFQDDAKYEHVGQDIRSQGGKDDQDKQGKDLEISKSKTKSKDNEKGSRSNITRHEGTSLQQRQRPRSQEHNDKRNLIDLMMECHNELTSGEIVSLKILSRTRSSFIMNIRSRYLFM